MKKLMKILLTAIVVVITVSCSQVQHLDGEILAVSYSTGVPVLVYRKNNGTAVYITLGKSQQFTDGKNIIKTDAQGKDFWCHVGKNDCE